ncbi:MAG: hypothetical protein NVS4B8_30910 [Herpetosiphon sp.]
MAGIAKLYTLRRFAKGIAQAATTLAPVSYTQPNATTSTPIPTSRTE